MRALVRWSAGRRGQAGRLRCRLRSRDSRFADRPWNPGADRVSEPFFDRTGDGTDSDVSWFTESRVSFLQNSPGRAEAECQRWNSASQHGGAARIGSCGCRCCSKPWRMLRVPSSAPSLARRRSSRACGPSSPSQCRTIRLQRRPSANATELHCIILRRASAAAGSCARGRAARPRRARYSRASSAPRPAAW